MTNEKIRPETKDSLSTFLKKELGISFDDFIAKTNKFTLKKDIRVVIYVQPKNYTYKPFQETILKKGAVIQVLGGANYGWQPLGYTNDVGIDFYDAKLVIDPLVCSLEKLVDAIK